MTLTEAQRNAIRSDARFSAWLVSMPDTNSGNDVEIDGETVRALMRLGEIVLRHAVASGHGGEEYVHTFREDEMLDALAAELEKSR